LPPPLSEKPLCAEFVKKSDYVIEERPEEVDVDFEG